MTQYTVDAHACVCLPVALQVPWLILFTILTFIPVHAPVYYLLVGTFVSGALHGLLGQEHLLCTSLYNALLRLVNMVLEPQPADCSSKDMLHIYRNAYKLHKYVSVASAPATVVCGVLGTK